MIEDPRPSLDALPHAHFGVVLADPPWHHQTRSGRGQTRRSPSHHYPTMSLDDIKALPVADIAARDSHLFLWVPGPHLVGGQHLAVMKAWGFKPSGMGFVWVKLRAAEASALFLNEKSLHVGLGYTTRKNAEFCLIGRRGKPQRLSRSIFEIIFAARREHSRKPDEAARRIEAYAAGPYLEMFAREPRPGWTSWGLEPQKFERAA